MERRISYAFRDKRNPNSLNGKLYITKVKPVLLCGTKSLILDRKIDQNMSVLDTKL